MTDLDRFHRVRDGLDPDTTSDLPTARLRQLRDGHNPDDATVGRARAARIAKLQSQIIEADELAAELIRYTIAARVLEVRPDVARLVTRYVLRLGRQTVAHRDRCDTELRALQ